jgi:hypothetical protein
VSATIVQNKDYKNKQSIVNIGATLMTKLGLEKRLFR